MAIRFFYNGIKIDKGPLTKARVTYHDGTNFRPEREPHVEVYGDNCCTKFPPEVAAAGFEIIDNTDSMTDYFESERFQVYHDHPLFPAALAAAKKGVLRYVKRLENTGRYPDSLTSYRLDLAAIEAIEAAEANSPPDKEPEPTPNNVIVLRATAPKVDPRAAAAEAAMENLETVLEAARNSGPLSVPVKVVIHWSEADAGLMGATFDTIRETNELLKTLCDELRSTQGGYYKTKFSLFVGSEEYVGRIDLHDGKPDTIDEHILGFLNRMPKWVATECKSTEAEVDAANAYAYKWKALLALAMAVDSLGHADLLSDLAAAKAENAEMKAARPSH